MSPMNEAIPYYEPGSRITVWSPNALRAKRFVHVASDQGVRAKGQNVKVVETSGVSSPLGIVTFDAPVDTKSGRAVSTVIAWGVVPVVAGTALVSGDPVATGANGEAHKAGAAELAIGVAISDCAVGEDAQVRLTI